MSLAPDEVQTILTAAFPATGPSPVWLPRWEAGRLLFSLAKKEKTHPWSAQQNLFQLGVAVECVALAAAARGNGVRFLGGEPPALEFAPGEGAAGSPDAVLAGLHHDTDLWETTPLPSALERLIKEAAKNHGVEAAVLTTWPADFTEQLARTQESIREWGGAVVGASERYAQSGGYVFFSAPAGGEINAGRAALRAWTTLNGAGWSVEALDTALIAQAALRGDLPGLRNEAALQLRSIDALLRGLARPRGGASVIGFWRVGRSRRPAKGLGPEHDISRKIIHWFETMSPETLKDMGTVYHDDVVFEDPFHKISGLENLKAYYGNIFTKYSAAGFQIANAIHEGKRLTLHWTFRFTKGGINSAVDGSFLLELGEDGRITRHKDFWDLAAQVYEKIPGLGIFFKGFRWFIKKVT